MPSSAPQHSTTPSGCAEHNRLLDEVAAAIREVLKLHDQQVQALIAGDPDSQFDLLIQGAIETKHRARNAYVSHVEEHGCSFQNAYRQVG